MKIPPIFVIKLKYVGSKVWHYVNNDVIMTPHDLDQNGIELDVFIFTSESAARKTMLDLFLQRRENIEAYKIVELSHYPPFPEHRVVWYKEAYES